MGMEKRKLNITMAELINTYCGGNDESDYFINIRTGGISTISYVGDSRDEDGKPVSEKSIRKFYNTAKYVELPKCSSQDVYRTMELFIETVQDNGLQELLLAAARGRNALHRFAEILLKYPKAKERWLLFKHERDKQQVLEWLAENELDLLN
jgi:hypothetical protein